MYRTIAMIPARYAATRFPGKLMQDLCGKTVIRHTYETTKNSGLFDAVYVVTDSKLIFDEIESHGGKVIMSNQPHECGSDRIAEAVADMDIDIVVNVQGDEPFVKRESLEKLLQVFDHKDSARIDLASLMTPIYEIAEIENPNIVKVITDQNDFALYFSRSPIPYVRDAAIGYTYYKHRGVYAFRKQAIVDFCKLPMQSLEASEKIECIRYLEHGKRIKMVRTPEDGIEIDTPEDLEKARSSFQKALQNHQIGNANTSYIKRSMHKNFPMVPRVIFGRGSLLQLADIIAPKRKPNGPFIYLVDDVFESQKSKIAHRLPIQNEDKIIYVSTQNEPETTVVDALVTQIKNEYPSQPSGIIGIGGGSVLDFCKAVAVMLTNPGKSSEYQGWDLVKNKAIYHVGIPTLSGTGSEVSRTAVLNGPSKKLGINSDYTPFDQVILDPDLLKEVPKTQWFYTGMDCYIHCIESLNGTFVNAFSQSYGNNALSLCKEVFLDDALRKDQADEKLMMASWHGGMSIAYSQVGIAHAMSYGLSYVLHIKHGLSNCLVFDHLEAFYPDGVALFRQMKAKHQIEIPTGITKTLSEEALSQMVTIALSLEPLWENALGKNWKSQISPNTLQDIYLSI